MIEAPTPSEFFEAAIELVEAVFGPDPEGRNDGFVAAVLGALRANCRDLTSIS